MSTSPLVPWSTLISRHLRPLPSWAKATTQPPEIHPAVAGALLSLDRPDLGPTLVNVGALSATWWRTTRRTVWQVSPATAAVVRDVGLGFLPEAPPVSWGGPAILVEGRGGAELVAGVHSLGCYYAPRVGALDPARPESMLATGPGWWWIVALDLEGGAHVYGLPCSQRRLNAALADRGELLEQEVLIESEHSLELRRWSPAEQRQALHLLRWLFAFSYFVDREPVQPSWATSQVGTGPLEPPPEGEGKAKGKGSPKGRQPLWTYRTLRFDEGEGDGEGGTEGEGEGLDTTGLERGITLVRPHWRRTGVDGDGQPIVRLVGSYAGHRWRRPERIGEKVRV